MRNLALGFALILALSVGSVTQAQENTVAFSILPGPFSVELTLEADFVVHTAKDLTGTSQGWRVTVDCTCDLFVASDIETINGQRPDISGGPRMIGRTLIVEPKHGMGNYRLKFNAEPGSGHCHMDSVSRDYGGGGVAPHRARE